MCEIHPIADESAQSDNPHRHGNIYVVELNFDIINDILRLIGTLSELLITNSSGSALQARNQMQNIINYFDSHAAF